MNRNILKNYAPKARRDFIKAVTERAAYYGLTKKKIEPIIEQGEVAVIAGKPFPLAVAEKRKRLEKRIAGEGFEQVMEAMAYTWFNRFVAIRFMELHGYLEHGYRVLSTTNSTNDSNTAEEFPDGSKSTWLPDIIRYAEHVDLPDVARENVIELKLAGNRDEELYRMLLVAQCNALNKAMPFLFEEVDHETELLLPENLLHSDSLIRKLVREIPEEEWREVEIIGWLYQFYISEKKARVIGNVVKSEDIPAATQLFTPNWIVKYMVQNTLGRKWLATYPNSPLKGKMEYYIEPAEQTPQVEAKLKAVTPQSLDPEALTLLDPACGSGHILVEAYDLLKNIYQERGYRTGDIPRLILKNNLFGLEIDDRAAQLAAFALMMKARADDRRIFGNGAKPNVFSIQETKGLDAENLTIGLNAPIVTSELPPRETLFEELDQARAPLFSRENLSVKGDIEVSDVSQFLALFKEGKTFGSLIRVPDQMAKKLPGIRERIDEVLVYGNMYGKKIAAGILPIVNQTQVLAGKYDAVVTNPPYMGGKGMNGAIKSFAQSNYPESKSDLFAIFMERCLEMAIQQGMAGIITMQSWMFLSSFEKLRARLLGESTILSMAHLGPRAFDSISGEVVSTTAFTLENTPRPDYKGIYLRLVDGNSEAEKRAQMLEAIENPACGWFFRSSAADFKKIPGSPIAYWVGDKILDIFERASTLGKEAEVKHGLSTGKNDAVVRLWFEVSFYDFGRRVKNRDDALASGLKWFPYNKGGNYRKWYGNCEYVLRYDEYGNCLMASFPGHRHDGKSHYFLEGISWTFISSSNFASRYTPEGFVFDVSGSSIFIDNPKEITGFLCSNLSYLILKALNPTLNFQVGNLKSLPLLKSEIKDRQTDLKPITERAIHLSVSDWDSYETSWDFTSLPLIQVAKGLWPGIREEDADNKLATSHWPLATPLSTSYAKLRTHWRAMTLEMQRLEEENNRIFIEAYGLQDELTPEVPLNEITLTCNPHYRYKLSGQWLVASDQQKEVELEKRLYEDTMKELVSYAVGCMMGRYSLDMPGLVLANQGETMADFVGKVTSGQKIVTSGQWPVAGNQKIVASGQKIVTSGQGLVAGDQEIVASGQGLVAGKHGDKDEREALQGPDCLAEGHGFGNDGLSGDQGVSKRGTLRTDESGATGGGIDSIEHCRRASSTISGGVQKLSVHSEGIARGSGNPTAHSDSIELPDTEKTDLDLGGSPGNQQNDSRLDGKTGHRPLATGHWPLATTPLSFLPDEDGILPLTEIDWFPDDAANRFIHFMSVVWPREYLEENLKFIAEALGPNRSESSRETIRRYFVTGFYKHHMTMYKKRPIYWLFSSGKERAFQCLVYLHRYNEGTLSRMRTEYVIPLQGKINARIDQLKDDIAAATSTSHKKKLEKEREKLVKQQAELLSFDEKLRHYADRRIRLDLDDGVKVNYGKFGDLLAEVKAVTGEK